MFFSIFIVLSCIFLLHYKIVGQAVYGDGRFYWAYLRSAVKDHDLDLRNELNREYSPKANNTLQEKPFEKKQIFNWFPIGASISWLPSFGIADGLANILHRASPSFPNNGYSDIYQIMVGLQNVLFVSVGIMLLYRLLASYFKPFISYLAIILVLFGTNLLYYGGVDVINSHQFSFFMSSLFLYYWAKTNRKRKATDWTILGAILGFMAMARTQDGIFGLLLLDVFFQKNTVLEKIQNVLLSGIVFLIVFSPQMFMWKYVFGSYIVSPYFQGGFNFLLPHFLEVLFNARNGLFIWTPLYILCFIGMFAFRKRFLPFMLISLAQLYLIMSWSGWNQGESFSIRMMITGLPYLAFGLAVIIKAAIKKLNIFWFISLYSFFILYNIISIFRFLL